jgi:hypothetical protein
MSPAQIRGSILLRILGHSKASKSHPLPKPNWSDLIRRAIDSFSASNSGVAWEVHACATWSPTSRKVDNDSEAEQRNPFVIKCCRDGTERSLYKKVNHPTTIEIGCLPTFIILPCTTYSRCPASPSVNHSFWQFRVPDLQSL